MRFIGYLYIMLGVMQSLSVVGLLTGVPTILAGKSSPYWPVRNKIYNRY